MVNEEEVSHYRGGQESIRHKESGRVMQAGARVKNMALIALSPRMNREKPPGSPGAIQSGNMHVNPMAVPKDEKPGQITEDCGL